MNGLTPLRRASGPDYAAALETLTAKYRRARGQLRRMLASQLIVEHEPLLVLLVDGMCGRSSPGAKPQRRMGGCQGFEDVERDDALQSARIACSLALDQFNPAKGKWAPYLKLKIRHEMQRRALRETWRAKVPLHREDERPMVDLLEPLDSDGQEYGDPWDRTGAYTTPATVEGLEGVDPEDIERWQRTGDWPETLEQAQASKAPPARVLTGAELLERFVAGLLFAPAARVPRVTLLGRWQALGGCDERPVNELLEVRGVRSSSMRVEWSDHAVPAFAGTTIRQARAA